MTEEEITRKELFRGGIITLLVFCVMYTLVFVEIALSFRPSPDGPILLLIETRFPSSELAGYYMATILDILVIAGACLCYYGINWVRNGKK